MKYLKYFSIHSLYEAYLVGSEFPETEGKPIVSLCKLENELHYNKYIHSYNLLDILYVNTNGEKKVDSNILDPSEGYIPIGLCIASTGFFGENEKARWMSLKYMNYETPETGSLTSQGIYWGNMGTDINIIDNIQTTYDGGSNWGYLTEDWITGTDNKIPVLFTEDNEWNISVLGAVNAYAVTDIDGKNKTDKILATATAQATWQTDTSITNNSGTNYAPAACCCFRYHTVGTSAGDWYLGASGEMSMIIVKRNKINAKLAAINTIYTNDCVSSLSSNYYWTSTEYDNNRAYYVRNDNGSIGGLNKSIGIYVVAILQY